MDNYAIITQIAQTILNILVGGYATTYLTEFLKLPFVKVPAEKYPRTTATVLSFLTAAAAVLTQGLAFGNSPITIAGVGVGIFIIATSIYNQALKGAKDPNGQI